MVLEIKSRRKTYKLTEKDRIMYNGKAYILMTQTVRDNFIDIHPTLTTSLVQKLIKEGKLELANGKFVSDYTGAEYDMYIVSKN